MARRGRDGSSMDTQHIRRWRRSSPRDRIGAVAVEPGDSKGRPKADMNAAEKAWGRVFRKYDLNDHIEHFGL